MQSLQISKSPARSHNSPSKHQLRPRILSLYRSLWNCNHFLFVHLKPNKLTHNFFLPALGLKAAIFLQQTTSRTRNNNSPDRKDRGASRRRLSQQLHTLPAPISPACATWRSKYKLTGYQTKLIKSCEWWSVDRRPEGRRMV